MKCIYVISRNIYNIKEKNRTWKMNIYSLCICISSYLACTIMATHLSTEIPDQVSDSVRMTLPYEDLFRSLPSAGIVIRPDMIIVDANNHYFEIMGLSKDIIGKSILDVSNNLDADSYSMMRKALTKSIQEQTTEHWEFLDNFSKYWHVQITPVFVPVGSHTLAFMQLQLTDHTLLASERKENANLLDQLQSVDNFKRIIDAVSGYAIFIVDYRGIVRYWNKGSAVICGWEETEAEGRNIFTFYLQQDHNKIRQQMENDFSLYSEATFIRSDGSTFIAATVVTPIMLHYDMEEKVGFAVIVRDLTQSNSDKEELKKAYEQAAKLKDEFTSRCSHDIRTPLNSISLAADALYATQLTPEQTELVYLIKRSTKKQLVHVNEILDFSKLVSGRRLSLDYQSTNLIEYLSVEMDDYKLIAREGIEMYLYHPPTFPYYLIDQNKLQQIVANLISNALKYTEKGYVCLLLSKETIDERMDIVKFEFKDSGRGVEADKIETLFTPYTQVDGSNTQHNRGSGLGLSIVKLVVKNMGGTVYMTSAGLGCGTSVIVELPLRHCQEPLKIKTSQIKETLAVGDGEQRILVAEDDDISRRLLVRGLNRLGYKNIDQVIDGKQLLENAAFGHTYNLVITDVQMPNLSGIEAIKIFRHYDTKTPVLALTADGVDSNINACKAAGMNCCYVKPIRIKYLSRVVADLLVAQK